jgi:hypothetical protein
MEQDFSYGASFENAMSPAELTTLYEPKGKDTEKKGEGIYFRVNKSGRALLVNVLSRPNRLRSCSRQQNNSTSESSGPQAG